MSDPVIISAPAEAPSEPFSERWGLYARYGLRVPISTSVTEGGLGSSLGLGLEIAENFEERYALSIEVPFGTTEQKILPSSGAADHNHRAFMLGLGRFTRSSTYFGGDGDFRAAVTVGTTPLIGFGKSVISRPAVTVDGERFEFEDSEAGTFDIGTNYFIGGEFRPWGRGPALSVGPALHYGIQYDEEGSEFNRIKLEFMLVAQLGYGDASAVSRDESEGRLGPLGVTQGLYSVAHGFLQRLMYDKAVGRPMQVLEDYDLLGDGDAGDRGSMADVPLLSAGSAFLAASSPVMTPALRSGEFGYWGFGALGAAGGIYFLAAGSDSAKAGGLADLLGTARLVSYSIAGINTPAKRLAMLPEQAEQRQMYINIASYALNSAVMLIGAAADSGVAMGGGAGANAGVAMAPDPVESTTVERTDVAYIPYSGFWSSEHKGNRAGLLIHKSWHDFPSESFQLFSSVMLMSPMLRLANIGNMPSQEEPYDSVMLTSDVSGSLGFEWKTTFTRLSFGLDTRAVSGSADSSAGIGGIAGFDLVIPFNGEEDGSGIMLGVRGTAHRLFPKGSQAEISPLAGVSIHF